MTVMIGIDPHKATHTAVAIDGDERPLARLQLTADRAQTGRLLAWAAPLGDDRTWAVESAGGLGKLLAQQLLGAGEHVIDVPPTLSARVRLLGSTKASKNDGNDALATAIAGLRHCGLRAVRREDHTAVIRLLIDRYDDLIALRTQAACRLHVALRELIAGGAPRRLSRRPGRQTAARRPPRRCRRHRTQTPRPRAPRRCPPVGSGDRHRPATGHRRRPRLRRRRCSRSTASARSWPGSSSATSVTPPGSRPPDRFASYNGTAPIEASSGPRKRHRLNPRGNRKLNRGIVKTCGSGFVVDHAAAS